MKIQTSAKLFIAATTLMASGACAQDNAVPANASTPAATQNDWLSTVNLSDRGGHVLGNPDAAKKVTEYLSYTCGHCATFEKEGATKLKSGYIATGSASLEIRNLPLNAIDLTVSVLARCGDTETFFDRHKYWMSSQKDWVATSGNISDDTKTKARSGDETGMMLGIYADMGLSAHSIKSGLSDEEAKACLTNPVIAATVKAMGQEASKAYGIKGTPSFLLNDKTLEGVHIFAALKPLLDNE